jgi:ribosomal protein L11 methyltransferase
VSDPAGASTRHPEREWYELAVAADAEAVEVISELLARYGFNDGVAIDEPYVQDGDGDNLEIDESKPFLIRTYIADSDFKPELVEELRSSLRLLGHLRPIGDLKVSTLKEEDWANAWKEHFQVHAIGDRVVIRPPWHTYEPKGDEVVVELDPGMAFGTGLHPTTRLSTLGVEQVIRPGDRLLDVGTGSGILAIAALKLGAVHADAVDVETVAVDATIDNARRNGVSDRIDVRHGSVGLDQPFQGDYDVVLANIIARILIELSQDLVRHTKQGGYLVLAGIIESREADVVARFEELGAKVITRRQSEDWISLVLQRA